MAQELYRNPSSGALLDCAIHDPLSASVDFSLQLVPGKVLWIQQFGVVCQMGGIEWLQTLHIVHLAAGALDPLLMS